MSEEKTQVIHEDLNRSLQERHIQLIALGGAIGVGLFLGSASAIEKAGPGVVLAYIIAGIAIFFVMRAFGMYGSLPAWPKLRLSVFMFIFGYPICRNGFRVWLP